MSEPSAGTTSARANDTLLHSELPILDGLVHVEPDGGGGRDEGTGELA